MNPPSIRADQVEESSSHAALIRELARTRCEVEEAQEALEAFALDLLAASRGRRATDRNRLRVWLSHVRHVQAHLTWALGR